MCAYSNVLFYYSYSYFVIRKTPSNKLRALDTSTLFMGRPLRVFVGLHDFLHLLTSENFWTYLLVQRGSAGSRSLQWSWSVWCRTTGMTASRLTKHSWNVDIVRLAYNSWYSRHARSFLVADRLQRLHHLWHTGTVHLGSLYILLWRVELMHVPGWWRLLTGRGTSHLHSWVPSFCNSLPGCCE